MNQQHVERPRIVVAVVGVATAIGKTWATAQILTELRARGLTVAARKPVQSFEPSELGGTDAEVLAAASGETIHRVCRPHRWYAVPMAPPMAAKVLQLEPIWARDLMDEIEWPTNVDIGFVETVGGVCSPMADDVDSAEFIALLQPDRTILVADAGLGTINAVRLSGRALGSRPLAYLNHYDGSDLHRRNRQWLETNDGQLTAIDIPAVCDWILEPLDRSR